LAVPPATFETATDPVAGSHLLAALAPVVLLDRQRLLAAPGPIERLELLATLLDDAETAISSTLSDDA
ncbi:MAG: hypothetical protein JST73_07110, partial [Actinobacteria bacterium]|nr:hypothetical protein [Actinomycetota bacterium]